MRFKIVTLDLSNGETNETEITEERGRMFLRYFLQPALRKMDITDYNQAHVLVDGRVVRFNKTVVLPVEKTKGRIFWEIQLGWTPTKEDQEETIHKVIAAFRLWGARGVSAGYDPAQTSRILLDHELVF